jgi:hypothetical protein
MMKPMAFKKAARPFPQCRRITEPEGLQHLIERLDTTAGSCFSKGWSHGPHFLLLILHTVRNTSHKVVKMGQDNTAHHNSNLLHNPDASLVPAMTLYCDVWL